MLRIYADLNCQDAQGRVVLNLVPSLQDLNAYEGELKENLRVILYTPGDIEVEGNLVFENGHWLATYDRSTFRDLPPEGEGEGG
jgi:hypothetical protein